MYRPLLCLALLALVPAGATLQAAAAYPPRFNGARVPEERMGTAPKNISPAHHVRKGVPPAIVFHGKADTTVPYATAEAFARVMKAAGNRCELVGYEGQPHGFFNHGRKGGRYAETLAAADAFLVSLGWLPAR